jgi:hypothetical protein
MMMLFDIVIVLLFSVMLKKAGDVICTCVDGEPSFFGMFRIPKHLWWHMFSFLLTYHIFMMVAWVLFGACGEKNDMTCAAACVNERVNAVKTLLAHQYYNCPAVPKLAAQPPTMIIEMLLDSYWH